MIHVNEGARKIGKRTYVSIKVFTLDIKIPLVHNRPDVVELSHEGMFDPIHKAFAPNDQKYWSHQPSCPTGEDHKTLWHDSTSSTASSTAIGSICERPYSHFHHVAGAYDHQHEAELETLHNVGHGHLKEVLLVKAFEDR